jgi:hypothetical protein
MEKDRRSTLKDNSGGMDIAEHTSENNDNNIKVPMDATDTATDTHLTHIAKESNDIENKSKLITDKHKKTSASKKTSSSNDNISSDKILTTKDRKSSKKNIRSTAEDEVAAEDERGVLDAPPPPHLQQAPSSPQFYRKQGDGSLSREIVQEPTVSISTTPVSSPKRKNKLSVDTGKTKKASSPPAPSPPSPSHPKEPPSPYSPKYFKREDDGSLSPRYVPPPPVSPISYTDSDDANNISRSKNIGLVDLASTTIQLFSSTTLSLEEQERQSRRREAFRGVELEVTKSPYHSTLMDRFSDAERTWLDSISYKIENAISQNDNVKFYLLIGLALFFVVGFYFAWYKVASGDPDQPSNAKGSAFLVLQVILSNGHDGSIVELDEQIIMILTTVVG